jgi:hypothetical protein
MALAGAEGKLESMFDVAAAAVMVGLVPNGLDGSSFGDSCSWPFASLSPLRTVGIAVGRNF